MSVVRMMAWGEIKDHKKIYAVIIIVISLTMTSFMLANAYQQYMMQVVTDTTKVLLTSDACVLAPDQTIRAMYGACPRIDNAAQIADDIAAKTGYKTAVRISGAGTYNYNGTGYDGALLQGIDLEKDPELDNIRRYIVEGEWFETDVDYLNHHKGLKVDTSAVTGGTPIGPISYEQSNPNDKPYPIVIGKTTSDNHGIELGTVMAMTVTISAQGTDCASVNVKVIGIYNSGLPVLDVLVFFMPADCLRELKGYGNETGTIADPFIQTISFEIDRRIGDVILVKAPEPTSIEKLNPMGHAEQMGAVVAESAPGYTVFTWHDLIMYASGTMQDTVTILLWGTMAVTLTLAGFAIKYVMDSIVMRKTREIGSLKAFGARDRTVLNIFLYQGAFIGIASGFIGIGFAILVMNLVSWYGLTIGFVGGTQLKMDFVVTNLTLFVSFALPIGVSMLAASIPAKRAAKLSPVEALRAGELAL